MIITGGKWLNHVLNSMEPEPGALANGQIS